METNENQEKDKKKKRPTLNFYQPPGSRQSNKEKDKQVALVSSNTASKNENDVKDDNNISKEASNDNSRIKSSESDEACRASSSRKSYKNNRLNNQQVKNDENENSMVQQLEKEPRVFVNKNHREVDDSKKQQQTVNKQNKNEIRNIKSPQQQQQVNESRDRDLPPHDQNQQEPQNQARQRQQPPPLQQYQSPRTQQIRPVQQQESQNQAKPRQQQLPLQQNQSPQTPTPVQQPQTPNQRGGILKVNLDEINQLNELTIDESAARTSSPQQQRGKETTDHSQYKTLFDPYNPTKPIYIQQQQQQQQKVKTNYTSNDNEHANTYHHHQQQHHQVAYHQQHHQLVNTNAINEAKANTIIQMMQQLEHHLKQLIESCDYSRYKDFSDRINDMRKQLERLCMQAILTHIESATKLNVDLNYWKICYHQIIENLRKEYNYALNTLNNMTYCSQVKSYCDVYINEGFEFYENLIKELERTHHFDRMLYLDLNKLRPHTASKTVKLAILCVNRCLICLGDLARYRESFNEMKDYCLARSFYLKAMYLAPKCSRAYNQLAILALYTRRRLDAVYYYIRCLELNQPLQTARQSLISLFDEARKRSEIITDNLNKKKQKSKNVVHSNMNDNSNRVELWMKASNVVDNTINKVSFKASSDDDEDEDDDDGCIDDDNDNNELLNLSSVELNKRFMHDYLNLIGKLFTKVGMESYTEVCSRMLHEFRELLKREACPIGKMRLLQITVINVSIINQTKVQNQPHRQQHKPPQQHRYSDDDDYDNQQQQQSPHVDSNQVLQRNQLQEFGVQLSLDMFAIIVKRLTRLLASYDVTTSDTKMREIFPSVKLFTDWMIENTNLWYPLPDQLPPDLGPNPDLFKIISSFLNQISKIDCTVVKFHASQSEEGSLIPVVLDEDREITGFLPLDDPNREITYAEESVGGGGDLEVLKDYKRLNRMITYGDYLCNLKKPVIKYDIMNRVYSPYVAKNLNKEDEKADKSAGKGEANDDDSLNNDREALSEAALMTLAADDRELSDLIEKRKNLKAKMDEKIKREKSLQTFVETTASRRIELEIRPRFLVPDTNCFIDHLNLIEILLKSNRYIIVIPLIVINELDKIAKSIANYNDDSIEHAEMVQRNAKKSMQFLIEKFESRERNLKALTSQGSVLETIQFRSEEIKAQGNNDDLILACCLHYIRDNARDFMPNAKNDAIHLFREVVLLTEDRNLRLKAHTRNVPVKNIINFCKWANLPLTKKQQQQQAPEQVAINSQQESKKKKFKK